MERQDLDKLLSGLLSCSDGVSDINFTVGRPPQVEVHGELKAVKINQAADGLSPEFTEQMAMAMIDGNENLQQELKKSGSCDCAYALINGDRFRVNIFRVKGHHSIVLRALPSKIPEFEDLNLPEILKEIPPLRNGLVLVTGSTGSGKSTTLAAIVNRINATRAVHIVTLEDPVEFAHPHKKATVNQRELGVDFPQFIDGLRAALRQAPKVILVGEMRDRETVEIALKASETGHLVLSTLHTIDAGQTINRIVGLFDVTEQKLVRSRLAQVLKFVVGQRLLPKVGGGRVAAQEIMGNSLRIRDLIINDETTDKTFYEAIADAKPYGWQTFDQHIMSLYEAGLVTEEVAKAYCSERAVVFAEVDKLRSARGEETSDIGDLTMDYTRKIRE